MVQVSGSEAESKLISILKVLSESSEPLGSITIARKLEHEGVFLSERAVRYHLRLYPARRSGWQDDYPGRAARG